MFSPARNANGFTIGFGNTIKRNMESRPAQSRQDIMHSRDAYACLSAMTEHNKVPITAQLLRRLQHSHSRRQDGSKA
jgi:hypothetical protein